MEIREKFVVNDLHGLISTLCESFCRDCASFNLETRRDDVPRHILITVKNSRFFASGET